MNTDQRSLTRTRQRRYPGATCADGVLGFVGMVATSPAATRPKCAMLFMRGFALSVLLFVWVGCGPKFDGRVYQSGELAFRVGPTPHGWRSIDFEQALLAFRDDQNAVTIALSGRCHKDGDDVPLTALTHHLFLHFTERDVKSQQRVSLAGRESLRTELTAALDGVSKHYVVYVLKKDGCVFDFMHIADSTATDATSFDTFVSGFEMVRS